MAKVNPKSLLAQLTGRGAPDMSDPQESPTTQPEPEQVAPVRAVGPESESTTAQNRKQTPENDERLDSLLAKINNLTGQDIGQSSILSSPAQIVEQQENQGSAPALRSNASVPETPNEAPANNLNAKLPARAGDPGAGEKLSTEGPFMPLEPMDLAIAGLSNNDVEKLVLKCLLTRGDCSGRQIAKQIALPFILVDSLLRQYKHEQLIGYKAAAAMNDYVCQLTDIGRERAKRYVSDCTYFGAAPVSLADYIESVARQSITDQHPTQEDLDRAFSDLLINKKMFRRLGPAINSGRGMFLFGFPGNGKTSIAERVTACFGSSVWVPRCIGVDGQIIRVFDPMNHEIVKEGTSEGLMNESKFDRRWVHIKRPTIIAGGELKMENLEVTCNPHTGINEAPLQMKSNCGTLVIDDFGRQSMSVDELLNRWIVPLEKRYDFLNLNSGKKLQVPFDQLIVFSTNLEPKDLVDDAFLRRIPYKIEVIDPSESEFRELFKIMCPIMKMEHDESAINYLIETHYKPVQRPFRCCQPRDLLMQVRNLCLYEKSQPKLSPEMLDAACENYFAVM